MFEDEAPNEDNLDETENSEDNSQDQPGHFDEKFDPATLDPALQPAYQQMRNAFLQKTQGLAEERRSLTAPQSVAQQFATWSPDEREAFFERAGLEYESGETEEYEDEDDDFFADPRVDVLLAERQAEQYERQQMQMHDAQVDVVNDGLEALEKSTGREFTQEEVDAVGDLAMNMLDQNGMPQVEGAYNRIATLVSSRRDSQKERKRQARPAPSGRAGDKEVDLSDQDTRRRALAEEIEAAQAEEI